MAPVTGQARWILVILDYARAKGGGDGSRLTHGRAIPVEHHGVSCPEGLD